MVREFYARCTNPGARSAGVAQLRTHVERFNKPQTLQQFARELGSARASGDNLLISLQSYWDAVQENGPTVARIHLGGPALPRAAYADTARLQALREHWLRLAKLAGFVAPPDVEAALRVDRWLAESPDPDANPWAAPEPLVRSSERLASAFPWDEYLSGARLARESPLRPAASDAVARIDGLTRFPVDVLRGYVRVMLVERASEFLSLPFLEEHRRFHDGVLQDRSPEPLVLADHCFDYTMRALDTWLAQAYLPTIVSPEGEQAARRMFPVLRRIFEQRVARASWMDETSRARALAKVSATALVFTADLKELNAIVLDPQGSFWGAFRQLVAAQTASLFGGIGRPSAGPPLLASWESAIYSNFSNQIWVSPAIARPPFLRIADRDPITYGAFGMILGHEIAHTLSVVGKKYDGAGIQRTWWSNKTVAGFDQRAECLSKQLDAYLGGPSERYPLDEFVADLGGVQIAVRALDDSLVAPTPEIIRERRRTFFTAYAQQSCGWFGDEDTLSREAAAKVDGVVANVPEFAEAFGCKPGSAMAPAHRCSIW
jgi:predicted metalloendopeptidase